MYTSISSPKYAPPKRYIMDKLFIVYLIVYILANGASYYLFGRGVWSDVKAYLPHHGTSEILYYFLTFLMYLSFTYSSFISNLWIKDKQKRIVLLITFLLGTYLFIIYFYFMYDKKYKSAFYHSLTLTITSFMLLYTTYFISLHSKKESETGLWTSTIAFSLSAYMSMWTFEIYKNKN